MAAQQQEDTTRHTATSAGHGRHDWPQAKHTSAPNADSQSRPRTNGISGTQTTDKAGRARNIAAATGKTDSTKQPQAPNTGHDTKPSHCSNHSRNQQANHKRKHDMTQTNQTQADKPNKHTQQKQQNTRQNREKIQSTNLPTPLGGYPRTARPRPPVRWLASSRIVQDLTDWPRP